MTKKEPLIILVLAVLIAIFFGYFIGFPLQITKPVLCIQMIGASCPPKINWINTLLDFVFWFLVLTVGWWGIQKLRRKG